MSDMSRIFNNSTLRYPQADHNLHPSFGSPAGPSDQRANTPPPAYSTNTLSNLHTHWQAQDHHGEMGALGGHNAFNM